VSSSRSDITRRDFLNGLALVAGAWPLRLLGKELEPEQRYGYYPPALTGLRGSHVGSFEVAHALAREGRTWPEPAQQTDSTYDLIIVGGGISGLSAAHFFRKHAGRRARILVLDNHDDFGGHAKRNELTAGYRTVLGHGGSQSLESPSLYSDVAKGVLSDLGIDVQRFYDAFHMKLYASFGLGQGVYFDRDTYGVDRLVRGAPVSPWFAPIMASKDSARPLAEFVADLPYSAAGREDVARVYSADVDYFAGNSLEQKLERLRHMSYAAYLRDHVGVGEEAQDYFHTHPQQLWGVGTDAVAAYDCWEMGMPGFDGLALRSTERYAFADEPYIFHFPDGNASVARLLVRSLVPGALPGSTMDDVVTARLDYGRLDEPDAPVRIRLNSTAVRVREVARAVDVTYVRRGEAHRVRGRACVLACYHMIIPWLCPELPEAQRAAMRYGVKVPLVYTNTLIRNWQPFVDLGVSDVECPGGYHTSVTLDFPVSLGSYRFSMDPSEPMVLHMVRTPCKPGLPARDQHRFGHQDLYVTPFETFEREIRKQLGGMLGGAGFDADRDILGITVNRWPHGYAYEYSSLWDEAWKRGQAPCEIARARFGRIAIANSDAGASAYANVAMDQAHRAVSELFSVM
jgi:spermidine dehydrogenase